MDESKRIDGDPFCKITKSSQSSRSRINYKIVQFFSYSYLIILIADGNLDGLEILEVERKGKKENLLNLREKIISWF